MLAPAVVVDAPPGWVAAELPAPTLHEGAGAQVTSWRGSRGPSASEVLVSGCVTTPIPGWVEDMRDPVRAKTVGLVAATAERVAGEPVEVRPLVSRSGDTARGAAFFVRAAGASPEARLGTARTFLGFDEEHVATCFALCVAPRSGGAGAPTSACDAAVEGARLVGSQGPPRPGLALGAVAWGVHHPRVAFGGAAFVATAAGILAVASRRRPRSRV